MSNPSSETRPYTAGLWDNHTTVERNNFVHKALSSFSCNLFVGCSHGCRFCYVPDVSAVKLRSPLSSYGISNPAEEWGQYALPRPMDERAFVRSLEKASSIPTNDLNADGNRAIFMCSTSDPYQVIRCADKSQRRKLQKHAEHLTRRALELIRDYSDLNVRILTRSPLAKRDFGVIRSLGDRAMLGISLPTLDTPMSSLFEPGSPAPKHRLSMLVDAHAEGIATFVAVAPVYPGTTEQELIVLMEKIKAANPMTVFFEPINLRLGVAKKIAALAEKEGSPIDVSPFRNSQAWSEYAIRMLRLGESAAERAGVRDRLHLWPDKSLGSEKVVTRQENPEEFSQWLYAWWQRKSEWPRSTAPAL